MNDAELHPLPIVDRILEGIHGSVENEIPFGGVNLSKELQKNVIEIVPAVPQTSVANMERVLCEGMQRFHLTTGSRFTLMGLGMHPLLTLDQTSIWDHEDREIYEVYDRLFDLRQHGWLNIQALQVNIHYANEGKMVSMFNRLRALTPYLVALTASSPFVEGRATGSMDNRLLYYRENQKRVPIICHNVIPEKLRSRAHHDEIMESIYRQLREAGGDELCHEWIDSRGVIVRYPRECLELKACDEQECIRSDMAVTAFVLSLLRADLDLEEDHDALLQANEASIRCGTASCRPELMKLYDAASKVATSEELAYLPLVERRIEEGSLAEIMSDRAKDGETISDVAASMVRCLKDNIPARAH